MGTTSVGSKGVGCSSRGLFLTLVSVVADAPLLIGWIWPPLLLLIAYWSSGLLFVAPSSEQESALRWLDDRLAIQDVSRRTPRILVEAFEAAYAGVYLLIPLALLAHLPSSPVTGP